MSCLITKEYKGVDRGGGGGGGGARGAIAPQVLSYWYEYNYNNCMKSFRLYECFNLFATFCKSHLCFHAIPDLACLPSYNSNTVLCHFLLDNATIGTFCTKMNKRNVFACHSAFRKRGQNRLVSTLRK